MTGWQSFLLTTTGRGKKKQQAKGAAAVKNYYSMPAVSLLFRSLDGIVPAKFVRAKSIPDVI